MLVLVPLWPRLGRAARIVVGGVFLFLVLGWIGFLTLQVVSQPGGARRASCMNNIRQIGLAMFQYAGDHDGRFPDSFGALLKEGYLTTAKVFICPSSGNKVPEDFPSESFEEADLSVLNRVDEWTDYVMVRGITHADPALFIVIHEKWGSHEGEGTNCFFNDGHVKWYPREAFEKLLSEQQAKIRQMRQKGVE